MSTDGLEATFPVTPAQVAELLQLVDDGTISGKQAKEVYAEIDGHRRSPEPDRQARTAWRVISDAGELEAIRRRGARGQREAGGGYRAGKTDAARLLRRPDDEGDRRQRQPCAGQRESSRVCSLVGRRERARRANCEAAKERVKNYCAGWGAALEAGADAFGGCLVTFVLDCCWASLRFSSSPSAQSR